VLRLSQLSLAVRCRRAVDGRAPQVHDSREVAVSPSTERLLTIGYQGRSLHDLIARLVANDVRLLLDIREVARSRRPEFNANRLAAAANAAGISYRHVPKLGSSRKLRAHLYETRDFDRFAGFYLAYVRRWRLSEVRSVANAARREGTVCILCYESDHALCHRGIVAAEALRAHRKLEVLHL
jgi:uncharacterized protein (DUF488 family)